MLRSILRQRRRLLTVSALSAVGFANFAAPSIGWGPLPLSPVLPLLGMAALGAAAGALVVIGLLLFARNHRSLAEVAAAIFFLSSLCYPWLSDEVRQGPLAPALFSLIALSVHRVLRGGVMQRTGLRRSIVGRTAFNTPLSPHAAWRTMVIDDSPLNDHWDALLSEVAPVAGDPDRFVATYRHADGRTDLRTVTYHERTAPFRASFHHVDMAGNGTGAREGMQEFRIRPGADGGSRIEIVAVQLALPPGRALAAWLDDEVGDMGDHILALHTRGEDWTVTGAHRRMAVAG